ncbi:MAG: dihydropteroate synthase [Candidatus Hydrogenedens sp.]|jgi:5-methyltetrahydrofolate--homocysteine methyltransferase|nr:dihydropteroate synthase [Candidatus Hydrogenedens sp.]
MKKAFLKRINERPFCLDGAMGTMIQGLDLDESAFGGSDFKMLVDLLCFSQPEAVRDIHLAFFEAGADAAETNSFGASPLRLAEYDFSKLETSAFTAIPDGIRLQDLTIEEMAYHLSKRAAETACEARDLYNSTSDKAGRPLFIIGSMGPSNHVVSATTANLRRATFDEISANFHAQALGLIDGGIDVFLFETQQDILELKAGVFGVKSAMKERSVELPIMAQVTVDAFSRMQIFNTDIHAALVTMQGTGIDVFGINCSIGPDLMEKTVEKLSQFSPLPISVIPNAGLPVSENGKTVFRFSPEDFAACMERFIREYGVTVVGGCCGTTPEHIALTTELLRNTPLTPRSPAPGLYVSGPQKAILLDGGDNLIRFGERLNIRGSKKVRDAVENDEGIRHEILEEVVREQVLELGCPVIDVCMDSNQVNTVDVLSEVAHQQTVDFQAAMCLDSFQPDALAAAVKCYPGRPILNSISFEESAPGLLKMDEVIEATLGHDPVFVALCTGPKGPGATAEEKRELASKIIERAREKYGITEDRIFVDVNVFPIGAESEAGQNFALETLEGIRLVKEDYPHVQTILGVGNLTNGLAAKPYMRLVLTSVFLDEARKKGLDAAIINPNHYLFVSDLDPDDYALAKRIILDHDMEAFDTLEGIAESKKGGPKKEVVNYDSLDNESSITEKIKDGFKERIPGSFEFQGHQYRYEDRIVLQMQDILQRWEPLDFVNQRLMAAMKELGDGFARGEVSLPHLLRSADVMRQVMGFIEAYLQNHQKQEQASEKRHKGVVVLGTVYQDVHSIGKDLARTLLENYGYKVIDLGVMTPLQQYIDTALEHKADAIGMSALLVQTSNHMITVSKMMKEQGVSLPILVGGAPVSDRHAAYVSLAGQDDPEEMTGSVFYCRTAMDGVNVMNKIVDENTGHAYYESNRQNLIRKFKQAQKRQELEAGLFATLPRRVINPIQRDDSITLFRHRVYQYPLTEFAPHLDRQTLFSLNWRFGGPSGWSRFGQSEDELEALLSRWVDEATEKGWLLPQGALGLFPCYREEDSVVILDPENMKKELARMPFTVVIGGGNEDLVSGAQYFSEKSDGHPDVIGIQLTTAGPQVEAVIEDFKNKDDYESALFLQGLSNRIAEDMADYLHAIARELVGVPEKCGQRWSPGYPGLKDILLNGVIHELVDGEKLLGVQVAESGEFLPTGTTGAAISFHPEARYI